MILRRTSVLLSIGMMLGIWAWPAQAAQPPQAIAKQDVIVAVPIRALVDGNGKPRQPIKVTIRHFGPAAEAVVRVDGVEVCKAPLKTGEQALEALTPAVDAVRTVELSVKIGQSVQTLPVILKPVRKTTVYILAHSHHDLGYTQLQPDVEAKQIANILKAIDFAKKTADYPRGAQFKWNLEVLWSADLLMQRGTPQQRADFIAAIKNGQIAINGMYANELTGLCRPEELLQLFRYGTRLGEQCGMPVDSAMISDVPGYTWGVVTALSQAGIRYFSPGPNYTDRLGTSLVEWTDKPFWWISPSGRERVLTWVPMHGYTLSHGIGHFSPQAVNDYEDHLDDLKYPYDMSYVRWCGHGDNGEPDPTISEFVKDWNQKYAWPKFIISSTHEAFAALEQKYGKQLPEVRGDWTPYWEDGAGSSALETAMSRTAAERLVQGQALFAMHPEVPFPAADFALAWRNVMLYSEHTWGAYSSVTDPLCKFTLDQWAIKRAFATDADKQSRELLDRSRGAAAVVAQTRQAFDVFNTSAWPRTQLLLLPKEQSSAGDRVVDDAGNPTPSQRLSTGELAFVARDVAPFAAKRYAVVTGAAVSPAPGDAARVQALAIDNGLLHVRVNETTGGIVQLTAKGIEGNLVDTRDGQALNDFLFMEGSDNTHLARSGAASVTVKENGPLVASLRIDSTAPGCNHLAREVRVIAGFDHVELTDLVDKARAPLPIKPPDRKFAQSGGKESVNFAFAFNVPDGVMHVDTSLAVMRPEVDQMPGACKNWLTAGRWVDIANEHKGVAWVTLDAPMIEVGGITANFLGSQKDPESWRKHIEPTQTLYSWVMNNHWHTNYRGFQEGLVEFRYAVRPHGAYKAAEAARFAISTSQPLIAMPACGPAPSGVPLLKVEPADVVVSCLKPAEDGKGWIVRLYGASGQDVQARLAWSTPAPPVTWLSDLSERAKDRIDGPILVPGWDVVTLRVERK